MRTECNPEPMLFARLDRREVVADFGGGTMTSDAGALLLGATDRAINLVERFAGCFSDGRAVERIVHHVPTLVGQRVTETDTCRPICAHAGRWWKRPVTGRLTLMEDMDPRLEAHLKLCHEIYLRMRAEGTWPWADSQFPEDLVDSDSEPNEP